MMSLPEVGPLLKRIDRLAGKGALASILLALALAGCGPSSNDPQPPDVADEILAVTQKITGSILVVPIEEDLNTNYGFGLYSTILFNRSYVARNRQFLEALTAAVPQVKLDALSRSERARRNAFFFPTDFGALVFCVGANDPDALFEQLSTNPGTRIALYEVIFGYDLSDKWLNFLQDKNVKFGAGPVLVTAPAPIGEMKDGDPLVVVTDLSDKAPAMFGPYVKILLNDINKPDTWKNRQIDDLTLSLANRVAAVDTTVKSAVLAVGTFIHVIRTAEASEVPEAGKSDTSQSDSACTRLKAAMPKN